MSSESNTFPIYIKLIEQRGEKTERLMEEIKNLSMRFNIYDEVTLETVTDSDTGSQDNSLTYCIAITPASHSQKSKNTIDFLEYLVQKMFNKYPALTEPPNN